MKVLKFLERIVILEKYRKFCNVYDRGIVSPKNVGSIAILSNTFVSVLLLRNNCVNNKILSAILETRLQHLHGGAILCNT